MKQGRINIIVSPKLMSLLGSDIEINISLAGCDTNATGNQDGDMLAYMSGIVSEKAASGKARTAETYRSTLIRWRHFLDTHGLCKDNAFMWNALSSQLIQSFAEYLNARRTCKNTQSFYFRILRATCNRARRDGHDVASDLFKDVYTGKAKTKKRALRLADMRLIAEADISDCKERAARDLFVFSFITRGMAMIDMAHLTHGDISAGRLTYVRHKSGKTVTMEWLAQMQSIADAYGNGDETYLFPMLRGTEPDTWHHYKKAQLRTNYHLKKLGRHLGLPIPLTMYVARHSWATIAKTAGIPTAIISDAMGHTSEKTTQIYLDSIDEGRMDAANHEIVSRLFSLNLPAGRYRKASKNLSYNILFN